MKGVKCHAWYPFINSSANQDAKKGERERGGERGGKLTAPEIGRGDGEEVGVGKQGIAVVGRVNW